MKILFENSYVRNKESAKEIYRDYYFQRKWLVVCYALLLLSFLSNIFISIFEKTPKWPHHPFCHCVLEDVPYNDVLTKTTSDSDYNDYRMSKH